MTDDRPSSFRDMVVSPSVSKSFREMVAAQRPKVHDVYRLAFSSTSVDAQGKLRVWSADIREAMWRIAQAAEEERNEADVIFALAGDAVPANLRRADGTWWVFHAAVEAGGKGVPLAWVVPAEHVEKFTDFNTDPNQILSDLCGPILDHCSERVAETSDEWRAPLTEAIAAARDRESFAAQALAAAIVDEIVENRHSESGTTTTKAEWVKDEAVQTVEEDTAHLLGRVLVNQPVAVAYEPWRPGYPPPNAFSRHATVHRISQQGVVTDSHSLQGVMLAVSLAREFYPAGRDS